MKKKLLTNKSGKVRELTRKDIRSMRPASEVLPIELLAVLPKRKVGQRGAQKTPKKIPVTVRYSPEVINYFRMTGEGWQMRMNKALIDWVHKHPAEPHRKIVAKHHKSKQSRHAIVRGSRTAKR